MITAGILYEVLYIFCKECVAESIQGLSVVIMSCLKNFLEIFESGLFSLSMIKSLIKTRSFHFVYTAVNLSINYLVRDYIDTIDE